MHAWTARIVGQAVGALGVLTTGLGVAQAGESRVPSLATHGMSAIKVGVPTLARPVPTVRVPTRDVWSGAIVLKAGPLDGARPTPGRFDRSELPGGRDRLPCDLGIDDPARLKTRAVPRQLVRRPRRPESPG
jgi:hypothetical protein